MQKDLELAMELAKTLAQQNAQPEAERTLALRQRTGCAKKASPLKALSKIEPKHATLVLGGALAVVSLLSVWARRRFYRKIVAKEVKKQLTPVNKKLDALQDENEKLHAEVKKLR